MDNEQSLNIPNEQKNRGVSLAQILYILRSHILLIVIITLLFSAGGFLYAKNKKPVYTATVPVQFDVQVNTEGELDRVSNVSYMLKYMNTAASICEKGIVLDRANAYYHLYKESGKTIDEFMDGTEDTGYTNGIKDAYTQSVKESREEIPGYEIDGLIDTYRNKWLSPSNIDVGYRASANDAELVIYFSLLVESTNSTAAREMAYIYMFAADVSLNKVLNFSDTTAGLVNLLDDSQDIRVSSGASTKKPVIIAAILGLVVSFAVIYMIYLVDNTVKSKEQLESLSGANVIAYIEDIAEVK